MHIEAKHYYLVSGKILFADPENAEAIGTTELNTPIVLSEPKVTAKAIGRAQQALQMSFFQRVNNPNLVVGDVFIIGISYLGQMTDAEFTKDMVAN